MYCDGVLPWIKDWMRPFLTTLSPAYIKNWWNIMILNSLRISTKGFLACKGFFFYIEPFMSKLQASLKLPPQFLAIINPKQGIGASRK
jgi:hypothetical protein